MNYENILITTENNIATITINRPKNKCVERATISD
jgi:enoyl-CoA hydratase